MNQHLLATTTPAAVSALAVRRTEISTTCDTPSPTDFNTNTEASPTGLSAATTNLPATDNVATVPATTKAEPTSESCAEFDSPRESACDGFFACAENDEHAMPDAKAALSIVILATPIKCCEWKES